MHIVVLSPHADDAVWSLGGWLAARRREGHAVTVVTVFDGDAPPAPGQREPWRQAALTAARRQEDARALARLDVARHSLGLVDAALRTPPDGGGWLYPEAAALFHPAAADLEPLIDALQQRLGAGPSGQWLVVPRGLGGHVDHVAVREAAARLGPTHWYDEFPYPDDTPPPPGTRPEETPADWTAWREAAQLYRSQVRRLFGTMAEFEAALARHARAEGAAAQVSLHRATSAA